MDTKRGVSKEREERGRKMEEKRKWRKKKERKRKKTVLNFKLF